MLNSNLYQGYEYQFPLCTLALWGTADELAGVRFGGLPAGVARHESALLARAVTQFEEYLRGARREFSLPFTFCGTAFQNAVWRALCAIPYGQTRSYKDIAIQAGNPRASRAVGMAVHVNPLAIIVPCHRVIGSDGSLTGFAGGLNVKQALLELEKNNS